MSPREFWKCTPRKLSALCKVHSDLNSPKKKSNGPMTVDGVPVSKIPNSSAHGVGAPNAFIDQL